MNNVKKGLLVGDYIKAEYHPLKDVDELLKELLKNIIEIVPTEDYNQLNGEILSNYDLCILYGDRFQEPIDERLVENISNYVKIGGLLLVIHNGISMQSSEAFVKLVGGRFTGHPEYTKLKITTTKHGKELFDYQKDFDIDEEPYRFELDETVDKKLILEYLHEGKIYPAGWTRNYGEGSVVYLMPGHELKSFENEFYKEILVKTVEKLLSNNK